MPDILTLDHEYYHFGHICCMVGDPLQTFRDVVDLDPTADTAGIPHHEREQFPLDLLVQIIDKAVITTDLESQLVVATDKGIECLLHHDTGPGRHSGEIDVGFQRRLLV